MPINASSHGSARRHAQAVTTAPKSAEADRRRRMRNYLIAMGIRTVSFPLGVWAFLSDHPVLGWIFVVNAVFIPYFAVAVANAVDLRTQPTVGGPTSPVRRLDAATKAPPENAGAAPGTIPGVVVKNHPRTEEDPGRRSA